MALKEKTAYRGRIIESGLEEKTTGSVQWSAKFELTEQKIDGEWQEIDAQYYTAYETLVNKNGEPNKITCDMLRKVFSWTFGDLDFLEREDWGDAGKAQVWVDLDDNNRLTIKYINPFDYEGGGASVKKLGSSGIQSLASKYGAAFRAMGGGQQPAKQEAPKPSGKKPTTPTNGLRGKNLAWAQFNAKIDAYAVEDPDESAKRYGVASAKADLFKKIAVDFAAVKQVPVAKLTDSDFNEFAELIEKSFSPAVGDIIPF